MSEYPPCPDARYPELWSVLMDAWDQATAGKGAERHGTPAPYREQPTSILSDALGPAGPFFQSVKKAVESERLNDIKGYEAARAEVLGHMVYAGLGIVAGDRRMRRRG